MAKQPKKEEPNKTLQQKMDAITFRNADANKIKAAQAEKSRLKLREQMGRKKLQTAPTPYSGVKGLQQLQGLQGLGKLK